MVEGGVNMNEKQNRSDAEWTRLMDIYKVQVQMVNDISNRRLATHRFYQLLLSGIALVFFGFLQHGIKLLPEGSDISIEQLIGIVGFCGTFLSWVWGISIDSSLKWNARKYEVLKELEAEFEYAFFTREWELISKWANKSYVELSKFEYYVPFFVSCLWARLCYQNFTVYRWFDYVIIGALWCLVIHLFILLLYPFSPKKDTSDTPQGDERESLSEKS